MHTTQQHLSIADIQDDILLLKDGGGALILQVSAVNFGLLSDREQIAIIGSFAQMLNSLSFSIQIVIISERLDISSYLGILDKAQKAQTNPLLSEMITEYKQFIQSVVKDMEVLDKNFYIVVPLFSLELGLTASREALEQKVKTVLLPRRDQIIRQLNRVGLKAIQLKKAELIKIFYAIYNGEIIEKPASQEVKPQDLAVRLKNPQPVQKTQNNSENQSIRRSENQITGISDTPTLRYSDLSGTPSPPESFRTPPAVTQASRTHPFVVEELHE